MGYLYLVELERGSGRGNRKWCARAGGRRPAGIGGGRVYINAFAGGITVVPRCGGFT